MLRSIWFLCLLAACSSDDEPKAASPAAVEGDEQVEAPAEVAQADAPDPIEVSRAIDAWQAVIERDRLLARRGDEGTVVGRIARTEDGQTWLLDRRETAAGLGIALGGADAIEPGQEVAVRGSWRAEPDTAAGWIWQARDWLVVDDQATRTTLARPPLPGTAITSGERPEAARAFYAVTQPVNPGDGWTIAGKPDWAPSAILLLPGDQEIYGGLDYRSAGERWTLEPGVRYAVAIEEVRPASSKRPLPIWRALGPPVRIGEDDGVEAGATQP